MINSVTFIEDYDLVLEKETQRRFPTKTIKPGKYDREKDPYTVFYLFKKGLTIKFKKGVNVIVGENGSGKTTLFSLIKSYAGEPYQEVWGVFNKNYKTEEDYLNHYHEQYNGPLSIEGVVNYKNTVLFSAEHDNPVVGIPKMLNPDSNSFVGMVSELFAAQQESHGESLISVVKYLLTNMSGGILLMDEPDTALSLKNQIWLANELKKSGEKNQIIISTHALGVIQQFDDVFDMETRKWVKTENYVNELIQETI